MAKYKIIIQGQPNTGKTTLARVLKELIPGSKLIEADAVQIQLIEAGFLPLWPDYTIKLGQLLHEITDDEKSLLKNSILSEIESVPDNQVVIIEGYALTLPEYSEILTDSTVNIYKESIHEDRTSEILTILRGSGMFQINSIMPHFYQRFEFTGGHSDSDSISKWKALDLHDLRGKRVLDVGCNTGFFTFMCERIGSSDSIGIDNAELAISVANILKNTVYLSHGSQFKVLDVNKAESLGKFDCIIALSMLHYIPNQDEIIKKLYGMLNPGGVLKLEMGIHTETAVINGKYYPSAEHIQSLFPVSISISHSVNQAGDAIPRYVITVIK